MEKGSKSTAAVAATAAALFAYAAVTAPKGWQKVAFGLVALLEISEASNEWRTS